MSDDSPAFVPLGDRGLQICFGDCIDESLNRRVLALAAALRDFPGLIDRVPAYASLTLFYDPRVWTYEGLAAALRDDLNAATLGAGDGRTVSLPVCYGGEHGPDLEAVAQICEMDAAEVVARHSGNEYRVFFLGFTPGFPYLGGMDPRLAVPRQDTPRAQVPAGSVGIAGTQTGVYPQASPGGWQLIGQTPVRLFDARRDPPCLLSPGDRVVFRPIDATEFASLLGAGMQ